MHCLASEHGTGILVCEVRARGCRGQWHRVLRHGHGMLLKKDLCKYTGTHHSITRQRRHSHALPDKRAGYRHNCVPYMGNWDEGANGTACCATAMACCSRKTSFNTGADKVSYNLGE